MADRSLTLVFTGRDAGASATAAELAARLKTLQEITDKNTKAQDDLNKKQKEAEKAYKDADHGLGNLKTTALALGPALIPIGTVGVGAVAGLVPAAGAAALAFLGLKDAWKQGTLQATALGQQIQIFQGEFEHLKNLAAGAVMPGLTTALRDIQPLFPAVNRDIALFGSQIGQIAANVAPGLVRIFLQLQPLFQTFGDLLVQGSQKFAAWAKSGDGVKDFVAYAQSQLPNVLGTLENLVVTAGHLVAAFAPFGSTSLTAIKLFSQALNAIPIGVLQTLVPLLAGAALGIKAFKEANAAAAGLEAFSAKLIATGGGASKASGFVSGLGKAVGGLGVVGAVAGVALGGLSLIMGDHAKAAQEAARRTNDLTQALQDGNVRVTLYSQLVQNGAIPAADKLGIAQSTVYDSVTKTGGALADLKNQIYIASGRYAELAAQSQSSALQQNPAAYQANAHALQDLGNQLSTLSAGVQRAQSEYDKAKQNVAEYAKAQGDAALAADILSGKTAATASSLGLTEDAYITAKLAADKKTSSDQQQTAAMLVEGNAAGLLTQAFNTLVDAELGASDANLGFRLANLQLGAALKASNGDLSLNTQAGLQNNEAINQAIRLAAQDGEALAKQEQSSKGATKARADGTAKTLADLEALRANIVAAHGNTAAIDEVIRKYQGYNATPVPPKDIHANDKATPVANTVQTHLDNIHSPEVKIRADDEASGTLAWVASEMAALNGMTAYTYVRAIQEPGAPAVGGRNSLNAAGTSDFIGGWSWVGERGPELMRLPAHTQIMSNPKSVAYAHSVGKGGGDTYVVNVNVGGSVTSEQNLVSTVRAGIRQALRAEGKTATVI